MALNFPNSPSVNDSFSAGGKTWVYNGTKWVLLSVSLNQTVADGAITTAKLADSSITAAKIADGTVVAAEIASDAVTTAKILDANITAAKIASDAVTTAKILDANITTAKVAANAITQAKLSSTLSAVTICTSSTKPASPFTGQTIFETDTNKMKVWLGSAWSGGTLHQPTISVDFLVVAGGGGAGSSTVNV